jgi:hypothetical protein
MNEAVAEKLQVDFQLHQVIFVIFKSYYFNKISIKYILKSQSAWLVPLILYWKSQPTSFHPYKKLQ